MCTTCTIQPWHCLPHFCSLVCAQYNTQKWKNLFAALRIMQTKKEKQARPGNEAIIFHLQISDGKRTLCKLSKPSQLNCAQIHKDYGFLSLEAMVSCTNLWHLIVTMMLNPSSLISRSPPVSVYYTECKKNKNRKGLGTKIQSFFSTSHVAMEPEPCPSNTYFYSVSFQNWT